MYCRRYGSTDSNAEYDPESIPSHTGTMPIPHKFVFGGATIFKEGMTVPESQQLLPQTTTVPELQERSTVNHILQ
jgi:hypothetical protein